jgi:sugar lactone lactonase YvrE
MSIDPSGNLYVPYNGSTGVEVFAPNGSGGYNDVRSLGTADNPAQVALDSSEAIYEAVSGSSSVAKFSAGTTGSGSPVATITGSSTTMDAPSGVAVDASGLIYVSQMAAAGVTVYSAGANGNVAPIRKIFGSNTLLAAPSQIAIDGNGYLYVKDGATIRIFAPGANGNVAPVANRPISGLVAFTITPGIGSNARHATRGR